ncbi:glycosyltransferase [Candidatus Saccharibacteria bacterium]|nr:glycosyltransferase [Candidatus Saccharibacteria bacterium]MBR3177684.1 glycosyltransferase [Candidatus Saccharibacteria bacterium]
MKIAIFSDCYLDLTGGIVNSLTAQKKALEDRGHTVYIFSTGFRRTEKELLKLTKEQIYVVPSCRWCFKGLTPVSRRPKIIEKWLLRKHPEIKEFDIFYVHYESGCSIAGLRLAKQLGIPSVQVMHGREDMGVSTVVPFGLRTLVAGALDWFHSWYLPHPVKVARDNYLADTVAKAKMWTLMVNHANYADMVLTPSEHFRKKLVHYGVTQPTKVLPNGYPDDKFPAEVTVKKLSGKEPLKIIWHSRVQGEKRIMPFLEALRLVPGKWQMDVYGSGTEFKRARRYARRFRLPVKFYGDTPFYKVQKAITETNLDVLVSYNYDTFGMTLIEAEIQGVPVFFCDPDMKEIAPRGGYVLTKGPEPTAMAEALNDLLAHPERIEKMSEVMIKNREKVLISKRMIELEKIFAKMKA